VGFHAAADANHNYSPEPAEKKKTLRSIRTRPDDAGEAHEIPHRVFVGAAGARVALMV
jgi:hypothetical protein